MAEKKYAKHLTKNPFWQAPSGANLVSTRHMEKFFGGAFSIDCAFITKPVLMITKPHKHDFDQYIMFFSANQDDVNDFDARIEMTLGDEREKQIITTPTIVYVPAGMAHGPLNFAKINKPVLFVDVGSSNKYYRVWEAEE